MENDQMELEVANAIMQGFGKFLEVANGPLMLLFRGSIPETLLPYPKDAILEALTIAEQHFRNEGMTDLENNIGSQIALLDMYKDNESSLDQLVNHLSDPAFHKHLLGTFGSTQQRQYENLVNQIN